MTAIMKDLENRFTHHQPNQSKAMKHAIVRDRCKKLAEALVDVCPDTRERSIALGKIEEAMFWGNAAIARNE